MIELETAQFYDIISMWFECHLQRQTVAYITCQTHIQPGFLKDMIDQCSGRRFPIAPSNANHF
ncbi:hypothetical protein SDC9_137440 [bioreactor metagenome]|uniref:Uncharacterized protein n=1 Tax=bioreactor metagenome TaxID=1076179 RepID=A0A645DLZ6_9ZZZZ